MTQVVLVDPLPFYTAPQDAGPEGRISPLVCIRKGPQNQPAGYGRVIRNGSCLKEGQGHYIVGDPGREDFSWLELSVGRSALGCQVQQRGESTPHAVFQRRAQV